MTWEHGLIMFFAGTTLTVIGFLIAFSVASRAIHKENKRKNRKYSSVEESLRNLNAKFGDTE